VSERGRPEQKRRFFLRTLRLSMLINKKDDVIKVKFQKGRLPL
jgi:hypothetical protein